MDWLVRFLHILGGAAWVGGYVMMAWALFPKLEAGQEKFQDAILRGCRVVSFAGAFTIVMGLILVAYTRGYDHFGRGEWGGMVAGSLVLAVILMGISDGMLRPAVRKLSPANPEHLAKARKGATIALVLGVVLVAIMARLPFARM